MQSLRRYGRALAKGVTMTACQTARMDMDEGRGLSPADVGLALLGHQHGHSARAFSAKIKALRHTLSLAVQCNTQQHPRTKTGLSGAQHGVTDREELRSPPAPRGGFFERKDAGGKHRMLGADGEPMGRTVMRSANLENSELCRARPRQSEAQIRGQLFQLGPWKWLPDAARLCLQHGPIDRILRIDTLFSSKRTNAASDLETGLPAAVVAFSDFAPQHIQGYVKAGSGWMTRTSERSGLRSETLTRPLLRRSMAMACSAEILSAPLSMRET